MLAIKPVLILCVGLLLASACAKESSANKEAAMPEIDVSNLETATFGAGCFWCVEAVFELLDGVHSVESGYMGGTVENPTYRAVCEGTTGHAEVTQIRFDPAIISFETLLDWLWRSHDPTTLNRQGTMWGRSIAQQSSIIPRPREPLLKNPRPPYRRTLKIQS